MPDKHTWKKLVSAKSKLSLAKQCQYAILAFGLGYLRKLFVRQIHALWGTAQGTSYDIDFL